MSESQLPPDPVPDAPWIMEDIGPIDPAECPDCPTCGQWGCWWDAKGGRHCLKCDPPKLSRSILRYLRAQYQGNEAEMEKAGLNIKLYAEENSAKAKRAKKEETMMKKRGGNNQTKEPF